MDNTTGQTGVPSALDKVAAALAALGPDTAAAIAQRAGVGYSTATKRLRTLAEAGQAESWRADDGRTLWRHLPHTATSTDSDDPPATTTDARRDPPPAVTDDDTDEAHGPAEGANTASVARPNHESTGPQPVGDRRPAPDGDAGRQALQDPPAQPDSVPDPPTTTQAETGEASLADAENPAAADASGQADSRPSLDPAGSDDTAASSSPTEAPSASGSGTPRRSKGSLRGAILDVLEAHPGQPFKTSQLCRAIDQANEATDSAKASAGAVVNAVHKLVTDGVAVQVAEKPATFQLAPAIN
ncbi:MarR family transcriptional regulator [Micromonospora sp. M61]|uniref:MarR family transcriptional regulator n=1 Tax=Micromonospora sp. M61 TaxID=2824890 RepID=UPI001B390167|nr:MarR family transcriptional regulator [Micromonospora sp. M61]MBQ0977887.1 MarR family transcriptional regulator [Micromonospora sp. M61]